MIQNTNFQRRKEKENKKGGGRERRGEGTKGDKGKYCYVSKHKRRTKEKEANQDARKKGRKEQREIGRKILLLFLKARLSGEG